MKVIITGGAGFIGGHAVRHFVASGDEVLNIDKLTYAGKIENTKFSQFTKLDICETEILHDVVRKFSPDYVVNFAAETHVDNSIRSSREFIRSNIDGATSVMDVCRRVGVPLCHISTDEVYGPATDRPFTEYDPLHPMNPYSATKSAADLMLAAHRNTHGLNYIIVRPSNNYGPGQHPEKFIPKLVRCLREEKKFPLYGVGDQEREWTYVGDTVRIIRSLLLSNSTSWGGDSTYNLSSGIMMKNIDVARLVVETHNKVHGGLVSVDDVVQFSTDRPGHDKKYWISTEKLRKVVNFTYTGVQSGIIETVTKDVR